jgi:retron-type reverse transcriptase
LSSNALSRNGTIFLADSYGYRPGKSALDAVGVTRQRCWKYDWVLEFDIKGLFDNIDHELLLRAVRKHVTCKWARLYIERWLTMPMEHEDGMKAERKSGSTFSEVEKPNPSTARRRCRHKSLNDPLKPFDACCPNCASWTDTSVAPPRSETERSSIFSIEENPTTICS